VLLAVVLIALSVAAHGSAQAADNPYNMEIFLSHDNDPKGPPRELPELACRCHPRGVHFRRRQHEAGRTRLLHPARDGSNHRAARRGAGAWRELARGHTQRLHKEPEIPQKSGTGRPMMTPNWTLTIIFLAIVAVCLQQRRERR